MKFSVLFTALFAALVTAEHVKGGGKVSAHGKRLVSNSAVYIVAFIHKEGILTSHLN